MQGGLAIIGFGEAGEAFARCAGWGSEVFVWDIRPERLACAMQRGLTACESAASALRKAGTVLCLVTADQALRAAAAYGPLVQPGSLWCDMNSAAPDTKCAAAARIERAGARYADVAIMAPVEPAALAVPMLIAGDRGEETRERLGALGFTGARTLEGPVGRASAVKMLRSVMIKGIEALTDEMMRAAEAAGVAGEVLASLDASEKLAPWAQRAAYNRERMATHGERRAAEMEEAIRTLEGYGVVPMMTRGTVERQRLAGRSSTKVPA